MMGGGGAMGRKGAEIEDGKVMGRIGRWFPRKHEATQD